MIKTTLAIALLLGYSSALTSRAADSRVKVPFNNTKWYNDTPSLESNTTSTVLYNVDHITLPDIVSISEFWTNKTNGTHCISLFERYYNLT
jgi:hypothetical protein